MFGRRSRSRGLVVKVEIPCKECRLARVVCAMASDSKRCMRCTNRCMECSLEKSQIKSKPKPAPKMKFYPFLPKFVGNRESTLSNGQLKKYNLDKMPTQFSYICHKETALSKRTTTQQKRTTQQTRTAHQIRTARQTRTTQQTRTVHQTRTHQTRTAQQTRTHQTRNSLQTKTTQQVKAAQSKRVTQQKRVISSTINIRSKNTKPKQSKELQSRSRNSVSKQPEQIQKSRSQRLVNKKVSTSTINKKNIKHKLRKRQTAKRTVKPAARKQNFNSRAGIVEYGYFGQASEQKAKKKSDGFPFLRNFELQTCEDISFGFARHKIPLIDNIKLCEMGKKKGMPPALGLCPSFSYVQEYFYRGFSPPINDPQFKAACNCQDLCSSDSCSCNVVTIKDQGEEYNITQYDKFGRLNISDIGQLPPSAFKKFAVHECGVRCGCQRRCRNTRLSRGGLEAKLEVFRVRPGDFGLRCSHELIKGDFIGLYAGEVFRDIHIDDAKVDGSYFCDLDYGARNRPANVGEDSDDEDKNQSFPIYRESTEHFIVDAKHYGSHTRFINHSCNPNCYPFLVFTDSEDCRFPKVAMFAVKDIPAYTEITFNYCMDNKNKNGNFVTCCCGEPCCGKDLLPIPSANTQSNTLIDPNMLTHLSSNANFVSDECLDQIFNEFHKPNGGDFSIINHPDNISPKKFVKNISSRQKKIMKENYQRKKKFDEEFRDKYYERLEGKSGSNVMNIERVELFDNNNFSTVQKKEFVREVLVNKAQSLLEESVESTADRRNSEDEEKMKKQQIFERRVAEFQISKEKAEKKYLDKKQKKKKKQELNVKDMVEGKRKRKNLAKMGCMIGGDYDTAFAAQPEFKRSRLSTSRLIQRRRESLADANKSIDLSMLNLSALSTTKITTTKPKPKPPSKIVGKTSTGVNVRITFAGMSPILFLPSSSVSKISSVINENLPNGNLERAQTFSEAIVNNEEEMGLSFQNEGDCSSEMDVSNDFGMQKEPVPASSTTTPLPMQTLSIMPTAPAIIPIRTTKVPPVVIATPTSTVSAKIISTTKDKPSVEPLSLSSTSLGIIPHNRISFQSKTNESYNSVVGLSNAKQPFFSSPKAMAPTPATSFNEFGTGSSEKSIFDVKFNPYKVTPITFSTNFPPRKEVIVSPAFSSVPRPTVTESEKTTPNNKIPFLKSPKTVKMLSGTTPSISTTINTVNELDNKPYQSSSGETSSSSLSLPSSIVGNCDDLDSFSTVNDAFRQQRQHNRVVNQSSIIMPRSTIALPMPINGSQTNELPTTVSSISGNDSQQKQKQQQQQQQQQRQKQQHGLVGTSIAQHPTIAVSANGSQQQQQQEQEHGVINSSITNHPMVTNSTNSMTNDLQKESMKETVSIAPSTVLPQESSFNFNSPSPSPKMRQISEPMSNVTMKPRPSSAEMFESFQARSELNFSKPEVSKKRLMKELPSTVSTLSKPSPIGQMQPDTLEEASTISVLPKPNIDSNLSAQKISEPKSAMTTSPPLLPIEIRDSNMSSATLPESSPMPQSSINLSFSESALQTSKILSAKESLSLKPSSIKAEIIAEEKAIITEKKALCRTQNGISNKAVISTSPKPEVMSFKSTQETKEKSFNKTAATTLADANDSSNNNNNDNVKISLFHELARIINERSRASPIVPKVDIAATEETKKFESNSRKRQRDDSCYILESMNSNSEGDFNVENVIQSQVLHGPPVKKRSGYEYAAVFHDDDSNGNMSTISSKPTLTSSSTTIGSVSNKSSSIDSRLSDLNIVSPSSPSTTTTITVPSSQQNVTTSLESMNDKPQTSHQKNATTMNKDSSSSFKELKDTDISKDISTSKPESLKTDDSNPSLLKSTFSRFLSVFNPLKKYTTNQDDNDDDDDYETNGKKETALVNSNKAITESDASTSKISQSSSFVNRARQIIGDDAIKAASFGSDSMNHKHVSSNNETIGDNAIDKLPSGTSVPNSKLPNINESSKSSVEEVTFLKSLSSVPSATTTKFDNVDSTASSTPLKTVTEMKLSSSTTTTASYQKNSSVLSHPPPMPVNAFQQQQPHHQQQHGVINPSLPPNHASAAPPASGLRQQQQQQQPHHQQH